MDRRSLFLLVVAAASAPVRAAWIGNPAHSLEGGSAGIAYDAGSRDVVNSAGTGGEVSLDSRGFLLEHRTALNPVFQGSLRVLPFTGRAELEGLSFNPHLAGGGVGAHFSPPEPLGPVNVGLQVLWNGMAGARRRPTTGPEKEYNRIFWSELALAVGASISPSELVSVYGGASWTKLDVHFNVGGVRSDWEADQPWGAFAGVELNPDQAWTAAVELRAGHERALSASLRYNY